MKVYWFLTIALLVCRVPIACCAEIDEFLGDSQLQRGKEIYAQSCAKCHGAQGQGVNEFYEEPLVGDDSVGQLAEVIAETMPEDEPEACAGEDASAVAAYIHFAFYSRAAQVRNRPPRIGLARLTGEQLRQSLADLYAVIDGVTQPVDQHGLQADYYDGDSRRRDNRKIQRVDPTINFDWGRESPGEDIKPEAFAVNWRGGLRVDTSGRYEIVVRSSCSFVMYFGRDEKEFINNHVQSGEKTEFRKSIALTGGRVYPLRIEFRQRKRKTELPPATISLSWVPPEQLERIIPSSNLLAGSFPAAFALQTHLPPDDRSYGFERGIAINREWDESTSAAAVEFAQAAFEDLWPAYRRRHQVRSDAERALLKDFLTLLVETAFRGKISDELRIIAIDRQVDMEPDDQEAIKRVMLFALKSPRFLYPDIDVTQSPSQRVANRLALAMFDSLPADRELQKLVDDGNVVSPKQIRQYVAAHMNEYRVRAKVLEFLHEWLDLSRISNVTKSEEHYPAFNASLLQDTRRSLDAFLQTVVWSERSDFREFFTAPWAFTTPQITSYYGDAWLPDQDNSELGFPGELAKTVSNPSYHHGILTHPYLMSGLAYYDTTSPIHRGVFLMRQMLGRTMRPPNEAFTPLSPDLHPNLTTRERVALQTSPESCQACHSKINQLGFLLENYDAVGKFRNEERGQPIDASGSYRAQDDIEYQLVGANELADFLASSHDAQQAFINKAFQFFVKQPAAAYSPELLDQLTEKFRQGSLNVRELLIEIIVAASQQGIEPAKDQLAADNPT
ncbi:MAG: DUF1588 domain-containing protein [Planctomycetales bacterium]|nr:DUF1588 domain-containing protein [Planctomycetales bacterium]